jgi:hypothetical protein
MCKYKWFTLCMWLLTFTRTTLVPPVWNVTQYIWYLRRRPWALSWNTGHPWGQVAQSFFEILSEMFKPKALRLICIQDLKRDDNISVGRFFEFFKNLQFQFIKILKIKEPPVPVFWNQRTCQFWLFKILNLLSS